ncbi:alpha/beta hydrolase [Sinomonas halotolerans]|uniref:Alpha/beta fold hydrolase n=1 Tax=Sinomonas halotolerans TaxID=1644133 RepID=A0ABU9X6A9_9MICC
MARGLDVVSPRAGWATAAPVGSGLLRRLPPGVAAAVALPLFMQAAPRRGVRPDEEHTHHAALRSRMKVSGLGGRGSEAVVYAWGSGDGPVVLVHGWGGRAAQFAPLVRELRSAGMPVLAFDAPAHGDSPGRHTYIRDFIETMQGIQRQHGSIRAVVAHSFGSLAAIVAVSEGLQVGRVATVAGAGDADHLVSSFSSALGLGTPAAQALRTRFARRIFPDDPDVYGHYSAIAHPLPASVPFLVVHDADDARVPATEADRLVRAHEGRAEYHATQGLGHERILRDEGVLAKLTAFATASA